MTRLDLPAQDVGRRTPGVFALSLAGLLIQLDVTVVNVALPTIQRALGASPAGLEWVVTGYALGLTVSIPVAGVIGDRVGGRPTLLAGLAVFAAGSIGAAASASSIALIASRIVQGVGGGAVLALTLALLAVLHPEPHSRARAIGWWAAIGGTGFGAGPIVGGALLDLTAWPAIFWINVPVVAVTMVLVRVAVPSRRGGDARRPLDLVGVALLSCGLGLVTYGLTSAVDHASTRAAGLSSTVTGLGLLLCFGVQQHASSSPFVPRSVRTSRPFVGACTVYLLAYGGFSGAVFYVTLYFQNALGWSPLRTGLSWLLMNVPFLVVAQAAGRIRRAVAPRVAITVACGSGAAGFALLATTADIGSFGLTACGYVLSGIGFGLIVPAVTQVAMRGIPSEALGRASAVVNSSRQLGTVLGLAAIGVLGASATRSRWDDLVEPAHRVDTAAPVSGRTDTLPSYLHSSGRDAFAAGFEVAVLACSAGLLLASVVAWWAFAPAVARGSDDRRTTGLSDSVRFGLDVRSGRNPRVADPVRGLHDTRADAARRASSSVRRGDAGLPRQRPGDGGEDA